MIALAIAYFSFRKGYSGLISSTFRPLLGERVNGPIGKAIDVLAIIATIFGVATSLGLGTLQINGGASYLAGIPISTGTQLVDHRDRHRALHASRRSRGWTGGSRS